MVETPKLSSLAGELLKFFILSSFFFGLLISAVLIVLGNVNPYFALGIGFVIAIAWVLFNILWTKSKMEELFGRLMYVIEILEEKQREKAVVPIPIHEEVLEIVNSIKELVESFEEKYRKEIRELEDQIDSISERAAGLFEALRKAEEGYLKTNFPSGLDPIGAIGQSIQQVLDLYTEKLLKIRSQINTCKEEIDRIYTLLEEKTDKIDIDRLRKGIGRIRRAQEEIIKELSFFKEAEGG